MPASTPPLPPPPRRRRTRLSGRHWLDLAAIALAFAVVIALSLPGAEPAAVLARLPP